MNDFDDVWHLLFDCYVNVGSYMSILTTCSQFHRLLTDTDEYKCQLLIAVLMRRTSGKLLFRNRVVLPTIDYLTSNRGVFVLKDLVNQQNFMVRFNMKELYTLGDEYGRELLEILKYVSWEVTEAQESKCSHVVSLAKEYEPLLVRLQADSGKTDLSDETLMHFLPYAHTAYRQTQRPTQQNLRYLGFTSLVQLVYGAIASPINIYRPANLPILLLVCVRTASNVIRFAEEQLKYDKSFALQAVALNGLSLEFFPKIIQEDRDVVLVAVTQSGYALQFAPAFKDDFEVVKRAVKRNGEALQFAHADLKDNETIVLHAIRQNYFAKRFASDRLLDSDEFINYVSYLKYPNLR